MNAWIKQRTEAGVIETPALQLLGQRLVPIVTRSAMPMKSIFNLVPVYFSKEGGALNSPAELAANIIAVVPSDISNAAPAVVTSTAHGRSTGEYFLVSDGDQATVIGLWAINVLDADTFELVGSDSTDDDAFDTVPDIKLVYGLTAAGFGAGVPATFLLRKLILTGILDTTTPFDADKLLGITPGFSPAFSIVYGKLNGQTPTLGETLLLSPSVTADLLNFAGSVKLDTFVGAAETLIRIEYTFWDDYAIALDDNDIVYLSQYCDLSGITSLKLSAQVETLAFAVEEDLSTL